MSNAKNTKIKYVVALDGHVTIIYMQQPTKNMRAAQWSGYMRADVTREECAWGMKPSFWGALETERR